MPATAPRTAARPQPSASIQETRIPCSRLDSGLNAAARSASPIVVFWKNAQSASTITSETAMIPRSCAATITPPMSNVSLGNGFSSVRCSPFQIHAAAPLSRISSPIVTVTTASASARWTGRITSRSIEHAAEEREHEREEERAPVRDAPVEQLPADEGREHRHLALREVDDPRRAVDQDEREREQRVDAAGRDPRHDLLEEVGHA